MTTAFRIISALIMVVGWPFIVLYAPLLWRSRSSAAGWNIMALSGALTVAFTVLALGAGGPWRAWLWLVISVAIFLSLSHRLVIVSVVRWRERRARRARSASR